MNCGESEAFVIFRWSVLFPSVSHGDCLLSLQIGALADQECGSPEQSGRCEFAPRNPCVSLFHSLRFTERARTCLQSSIFSSESTRGSSSSGLDDLLRGADTVQIHRCRLAFPVRRKRMELSNGVAGPHPLGQSTLEDR